MSESKSTFKKALKRIGKFFLKIVPHKGDGKKSVIIKTVALVAALGLVISGTYIVWYFNNLSEQDKKLDNLRAIYNLNRENYEYNVDGQFSKFDDLKKKNPDVVGWINIPGTDIDNPFYQCDDNDYYITHDSDRESNSYGAIFLDFRCDISKLSTTQNQILYGHNMRYGAMFGTLRNYRELEFYQQHPIVNVDTLYESLEYKIFAIMVVSDTVDNTFGYDFTPYKVSFTNQNEFTDWVYHCKQRSLITTNVDVTANDQVLTMSTCCYDFDNARLVIIARRLRENEDPGVDTSAAITNKSVLYPGAYYKKKGIAIPNV